MLCIINSYTNPMFCHRSFVQSTGGVPLSGEVHDLGCIRVVEEYNLGRPKVMGAGA